MRILYVGRSAAIGGGSTFRLNIARGLIPLGHRVWVAAWPGQVAVRYRRAGIGYVRTPPAPLSAPFILRAIREHGIVLVHASNTRPGDAAAWACVRAGTPLVLSIHGLLNRHECGRPCFSQAERIVAFDESAIDRLKKHDGMIDAGKLRLLRRPAEHRPRSPGEGFNVVYVGRLSQRKGQLALDVMAAFRSLLERNRRARLTILGDGTLLRAVRQRVARLNRERGEEVVRAPGSLADPSPVVGNAHLVIGAGYAALEALMQGLAVIGAGFWGFGPISENNVHEAIMTNSGDSGGEWPMNVESFRHALEELHAGWTGGRRERYWHLDRLIEAQHSIDAVARDAARLYEELLRGTRSAHARTPGGPAVTRRERAA